MSFRPAKRRPFCSNTLKMVAARPRWTASGFTMMSVRCVSAILSSSTCGAVVAAHVNLSGLLRWRARLDRPGLGDPDEILHPHAQVQASAPAVDVDPLPLQRRAIDVHGERLTKQG